jgi:hypothetical protein
MKRKWYVPVEHIRDSLIVVHVCKGEKLPYRKGIPVKGFVPCRCNAEHEHEVARVRREINERLMGSSRTSAGKSIKPKVDVSGLSFEKGRFAPTDRERAKASLARDLAPRSVNLGYRMTNYAVPAASSSVYHKFSSSVGKHVTDIYETRPKQGVVRKGKVVPKRPAVAKQQPEQHVTIAPKAPNLGRKWYRKTKMRGMDD